MDHFIARNVNRPVAIRLARALREQFGEAIEKRLRAVLVCYPAGLGLADVILKLDPSDAARPEFRDVSIFAGAFLLGVGPRAKAAAD